MTPCIRLLIVTLILTLASFMPRPVGAAEEERHCPAATAENSLRLFSKDADSSAEKKRVSDLARTVIKNGSTVCLLALMDPSGAAYSKKLALNRVNWMRGNLMKEGVPVAVIGYELRPAETVNDSNIASVLIISSP